MAAIRTRALWIATLLLATAASASARPEASDKIPPNLWGCTLCHAGDGATVDSVPVLTATEFTDFGLQWLALADAEIDRLWADMAPLNADADGCSNGCEMDDPAGLYENGDPVPVQRCAEGDPNVTDCTVPLDENSWSTLKSLFSDN